MSLILIMGFISCESYLDREDTSGIISSDVIWQNKKGVEALLVNMYDELRLDEHDDFFTGKSNLLNLTSLSDEAQGSYQKDYAFSNANAVYTYSDYVFEDKFENRYKQIRITNGFIEKVKLASVLTKEDREIFEAEGRFIRAMHYFGLVKRYGGVPLIKKPQEYVPGDFSSLNIERNTEAETYNFIIDECKEISKILSSINTVGSNGKFRATKGAALALCSRAGLYAGSIAKYSKNLSLGGEAISKGYVGIPESEANYFFNESYIASTELLSMTESYSLYDRKGNSAEDKATNFYDLFSSSTNGANGEYIFMKQYNSTSEKGHMWDKLNAPFSYRGDGWGCGMAPNLEMVESFDYIDGTDGKLVLENGGIPIEFDNPIDLFRNKDPRMFASIYVPGSPCKGSEIEWLRGVINGEKGSGPKYQAQNQPDKDNEATINGVKYKTTGKDGGADVGDASKTSFYQKKFFDETLENMTNIDAKRSSTPWVVFRLGEIYLNFAEACVELGGKETEALSAVNTIRKRAGVKEYTSISLERVRKERKTELAFEKLRFWDLKRWRVAHLDYEANGIGLTNFRGTALYPWYNIQSGKYTFERGVPPKQKRLFLERNYYVRISPADLSSNPLLVQNPGYGN